MQQSFHTGCQKSETYCETYQQNQVAELLTPNMTKKKKSEWVSIEPICFGHQAARTSTPSAATIGIVDIPESHCTGATPVPIYGNCNGQ